MNRAFFIFLLTLFITGCSAPVEPDQKNNVIIDIQPFTGFPNGMTLQVALQLQSICSNINIKPEINLPPSAYYAPKKRYRADTIISVLKRSTLAQHVTIGLTNFDISTTNDKVEDWGVMGLGYRPGNACVVSTFRLRKKTLDNQFYKVCIHELGHTAGLDHCPEKTCFMRDAKGGNPLDEEVAFCNKCKSALIKKGWRL